MLTVVSAVGPWALTGSRREVAPSTARVALRVVRELQALARLTEIQALALRADPASQVAVADPLAAAEALQAERSARAEREAGPDSQRAAQV